MTHSTDDRIPAEVFHPSEFITEEMEARGWDRDDLAMAMAKEKTAYEFGIERIALDFYLDLGPTEPDLRLGDGEAFARAFGTSAEFWRNLEASWLKGQKPWPIK